MINKRQPANPNGQWLVLWVHGGRIASWPLHDRAAIESAVHTSLIQRDANGTEHVNVLGVRR